MSNMLVIFVEINLRWMQWNLIVHVNIGSGNRLLLQGNISLPESMLTKIYDATWHH